MQRYVLFVGASLSLLGSDVIAIWPNKNAKTPSMVLGATLK